MTSGEIWEKLEKLSQQNAASDLVAKPTLFGERHAPDVRGSLTNVTSSNTSLASVWSALCTGIISNLQAMMSREQVRAAGVRRVVASGRIVSSNAIVRGAIEREFGLPVVVSDDARADAAVGAAMAASQYAGSDQ